jgi:uncharacterized membrane protein YccC
MDVMPTTRWVSGWRRTVKADPLGVHFVNVFVATIALWLILRMGANTNPIWAIASMIATSEPQIAQSLLNFRARIVNTLLGCVTGMLVLVVGGSSEWKLPPGAVGAPRVISRAWARSRLCVSRLSIPLGSSAFDGERSSKMFRIVGPRPS